VSLCLFQVFVCVAALVAVTAGAPNLLVGSPVHGVHGLHAGQTHHQSVTKGDGEVRAVQVSKAFGAGHAAVHQFDNSKGLAEIAPAHGAVAHAVHAAPIAHAVHAAPIAHAVHAAPIAHAVHAAPIAHAVHAPVAHAVHAGPIAHAVHAAPIAHAVHAAPLVAHAPVVHHEDYAEPSPYTYEYAVADDYSQAAFNAAETSDGAGTVSGSYSVALPDGRTQHVNYKADGYNGYVAEVTYEGQAVYPEAPVIAHAAPVAHAVHAAPVAHAVHAAPVLAHAAPVAHAVHAAPVLAHAAPVAHAVHAAPVLAHAAPVVRVAHA